MLAHYMADSVTFDLAPPLISTGTDAKGLRAWFATWRGGLGYEIRDLTIFAGADAAFCHSLNRLSGTKTDGEKDDIWFRLTLWFPQHRWRMENRASARIRAVLHGRQLPRSGRPEALAAGRCRRSRFPDADDAPVHRGPA